MNETITIIYEKIVERNKILPKGNIFIKSLIKNILLKSNTTIIRAECFIVHQPDLNSEYFSWLQKPYTQSDPLIDSFTWIIAGNIMWSWRFFPTGRSATNGICNEYIDWSTIHNPHYLTSNQGIFRYYQVMIQVFKIWINC